MKIHFTGEYRIASGRGLLNKNSAVERYEFDWEGEDFTILFKIVNRFDDERKKILEAEQNGE